VNGFLHNLTTRKLYKIYPNHLSFANVGTSKVLRVVSVCMQIIFAKFIKDCLMIEMKNQKSTNAQISQGLFYIRMYVKIRILTVRT